MPDQPASPTAVPVPTADQQRIAAESFTKAREAIGSGQLDYAIALLLTVNHVLVSSAADLEAAGFQVNQQPVSVSDASQDGIVQAQNPDGGSHATKGSTVTITVGQFSPGPGTTTTTG